jgi:hypothetical protein
MKIDTLSNIFFKMALAKKNSFTVEAKAKARLEGPKTLLNRLF